MFPFNQMKTLPLILVLGLASGGCSKSPSNGARSFQQVYPDMQVVIEKGVDRHVARPQLNSLKAEDRARCHYVGTLKLGDGQECSAKIEYRGTQSDKDYYWVTLTAPAGAGQVPAPAEIAYDGREIELWKEAGWRVRMCPVRSGASDGAASGSQPTGLETNSTPPTAGSRR